MKIFIYISVILGYVYLSASENISIFLIISRFMNHQTHFFSFTLCSDRIARYAHDAHCRDEYNFL